MQKNMIRKSDGGNTYAARFPEKVRYAAETNEPSQVARFLLDLTGEFSTYYRANKVADPDHPERSRERGP
jgi:arginyl-tRNA synthetase